MPMACPFFSCGNPFRPGSIFHHHYHHESLPTISKNAISKRRQPYPMNFVEKIIINNEKRLSSQSCPALSQQSQIYPIHSSSSTPSSPTRPPQPSQENEHLTPPPLLTLPLAGPAPHQQPANTAKSNNHYTESTFANPPPAAVNSPPPPSPPASPAPTL